MSGNNPAADTAWSPLSLEEIKQALRKFADDRDWEQFHTPRNLLLALVRVCQAPDLLHPAPHPSSSHALALQVGEVGELSELFQWRGEVAPGLPGFTEAEKRHVGEEMSDVLLYLVRLADRCGVDLGAAVADKMDKNAAKYPATHCKGSAAKYHAYGGD